MSKQSDDKANLQSPECPRCGCRPMYVVDTRSTPKRIIRIRECRCCGRRLCFLTIHWSAPCCRSPL